MHKSACSEKASHFDEISILREPAYAGRPIGLFPTQKGPVNFFVQKQVSYSSEPEKRKLKDRKMIVFNEQDHLCNSLGVYMKNMNSWDFNVWECKDEEMEQMAAAMFLPFLNLLNIEKKAIDRFVAEVHKKYNHPPYHNFRHALEVSQFVYKLDHDGLLKEKFSPIERFTLLLAAIGHDIGHPGKNNNFQNAFKTPIYERFGETSTLERFHIETLLQLIRMPEIGLLKNLPTSSQEQIEKFITELILSTDMAYHDELVLKIKHAKGGPHILGILIMKCADLSQLIRPKFISDRWVAALYEEQLLQRKEEKAKGLDDHVCDADFAEKQVQYQPVFLKRFAEPLFEELFQVFPQIRMLEERLKDHSKIQA